MYWQSSLSQSPVRISAGLFVGFDIVRSESIMLIRDKQARAATKLRRDQEARQAMKEHEAERLAVRAKTQRLRAERLAREAATSSVKQPKKGR
jgi:hypothetical protein